MNMMATIRASVASGAASAPRPAGVLGADERAAVLASFGDGRGALAAGAMRRATRMAFGLKAPAPLTGARLEALRRYALLYRLEGTALALDEDARLAGAGVSEPEAAAARALVDARPVRRPARGGGRAGLLLLLAICALAGRLLYVWLARQFDDPLGAFVVTVLLSTWFVSIAAVTGHPRGRHA